MSSPPISISVIHTAERHLTQVIELTRKVYPHSEPWTLQQLRSHQAHFPEGQFVAVAGREECVVGASASLIVRWDDYEVSGSWRDFTGHGTFSNHDPHRGRTLYGAEVMVAPELQGHGVGGLLYAARRQLTQRLGLMRIRSGARLRGYSRHAAEMSAEEYVKRAINGRLRGPTLSFQLGQGFRVLAVVSNYLRDDPESLGYAAVIEWLNPLVATQEDYDRQYPQFAREASDGRGPQG